MTVSDRAVVRRVLAYEDETPPPPYPGGLVAHMQKNSERQQLAKYGKGPYARVAKMAVGQRTNIRRKEDGLEPVEIRPL